MFPLFFWVVYKHVSFPFTSFFILSFFFLWRFTKFDLQRRGMTWVLAQVSANNMHKNVKPFAWACKAELLILVLRVSINKENSIFPFFCPNSHLFRGFWKHYTLLRYNIKMWNKWRKSKNILWTKITWIMGVDLEYYEHMGWEHTVAMPYGPN